MTSSAQTREERQRQESLDERLQAVESRLDELERWRESVLARQASRENEPVASPPAPSARPVVPASPPDAVPEDAAPLPAVEFDLSLVGRLLIVLGGAFLLRAITESGVLSPVVGVSLGLAYALAWIVVALRHAVSRTSAAYHGLAAVLASYPLIFEAVRKFDVLGAWSSAAALALAIASWGLLVWRKRLHGIAWTATLGAMGTSVLLMAETSAMIPFVWVLIGLGVATLWMGYHLKWHFLRWPVAAFLDALLLFMAFLVVTGRSDIEPAVAMAAGCGAFAAYLASFVLRNLVRERSIVRFEVAQTLAAVVTALGGAMWIAVVRQTLELPLGIALLAIAAASYAASFVFIPRHFTSPGNFFFYSSLALVLVLAGGSLVTGEMPVDALWSAFALTAAWFAGRYEKPVLAMHCAIYLVAGLVGSGLVQAGFRTLVLAPTGAWDVPWPGAVLILVTALFAAGIHPIERKGSFAIWSFAKALILTVLAWASATMLMALVGRALHGETPDAALVSFERTAILSGLTIVAALVARHATLSPGRTVANILMVALAMKLLWDDLRAGTALTMFLSFACVGLALIVATKLKKRSGSLVPGS